MSKVKDSFQLLETGFGELYYLNPTFEVNKSYN